MAKPLYKHPLVIVGGAVALLLLLSKAAHAAAQSHWKEVTTPTPYAPLLPTGRVRFSAPKGALPDPIGVALDALPLDKPQVFVGDDKTPSDWPDADLGGNRNRVEAVNMGPAVPLAGARVWTYA